MLPADVQAIIRKPEKERTVAGAEDRRRLLPRSCGSTRTRSRRSCRPMSARSTRSCRRRLTKAARGRRRPARRRPVCPPSGPSKSTRSKRAGEELHPDQRRSGPAREESRGRARLAVRAGEDRFPRRPDRGVLRLADRAGESAVRPRGRQPTLAVAFRRGPAEEPQRFRQARRQSQSNPQLLDWLASEFVARTSA